MECKAVDPRLLKMSALAVLFLCCAVGRAQAAGENVEIVVVNGSLTDLVAGGTLSLRCEVTSLMAATDLTVAWLRGADVISIDGALTEPYAASPRFAVDVTPLPGRGDTTQDTAHRLTVSSLRPTDAGDYTCLLNRSDPLSPGSQITLISQTVVVTVLYFPDGGNPVCSPDGPVDVREGEVVLMSCSTEKGNPQVMLTLTGSVIPGPWSNIQNADTISQEFLLDGVTASSDGLLFTCQIESFRFPGETRSCVLGPINVVPAPMVTSLPATTANSAGSGEPMGPLPPTQATTYTVPPDPACMRWLIAFVVAAGVATLSIVGNVVFLTLRKMEKDRKTSKDRKREDGMVMLDDMSKKSAERSPEDEAHVNVTSSAD